VAAAKRRAASYMGESMLPSRAGLQLFSAILSSQLPQSPVDSEIRARERACLAVARTRRASEPRQPWVESPGRPADGLHGCQRLLDRRGPDLRGRRRGREHGYVKHLRHRHGRELCQRFQLVGTERGVALDRRVHLARDVRLLTRHTRLLVHHRLEGPKLNGLGRTLAAARNSTRA
jgi:hypothetical protein